MATKNNITTSLNIEKLFEEFTSSLGLSQEEKKELSELPKKIQKLEEEIIQELKNKDEVQRNTSVQMTTTLGGELFKDLGLTLEKLELMTITEDTISTLEQQLKIFQDYVNKKATLKSLEGKDGEKTGEDLDKINQLTDYIKQIDEKNPGLIAELTASYKNPDTMQMFYDIVKQQFELKRKLSTFASNESQKKDEITKAEARLKELTDKANTPIDPSLENFIKFLKDNGYSTIHAEEIFNAYHENKDLTLNSNSFNIRKRHPKRDAVIKKGVVPTLITCASIGIAVAIVAASGLTAGASLGLLPVMSSPLLTFAAAGTIGVGAGLILTPAVLFAKNKGTKAHYKAWYKDAAKNLEAYENGTKIEDLHITKLMEKIAKTKEDIINLNKGGKASKFFKFIPRHILNAINRNRIHHVEAYTKDLFKVYLERENKNLSNSSVLDLIKYVEDFINKDTFESKLDAMLSCGDSTEHTHQSTIENLDIYANLKIALSAFVKKQSKNTVTTAIRNLNNKKSIASKILNNGIGLLSLLREKISSDIKDESANDGNTNNGSNDTPDTKVDVKDEPANSSNADSNDTPDTKVDVKDEPANNGSLGTLVKRTTQRLTHSTKPITYGGKKIGVTLTVDVNGEKEKTEIKYVNKKIRIKSGDEVRFVEVTDTIIPPMNQINQILKDVAEEKHIENADSLTVS